MPILPQRARWTTALPFRAAALSAAGLVAGHLGLVALTRGQPVFGPRLSAVYLTLVSGLATFALLQAAGRSGPARGRVAWGWRLLAVALGLATLSNLAWAVTVFAPEIELAVLLQTAGILLAYLLMSAGLVLIPAAGVTRAEAVWRLLDMGLVLVAGAGMLGAFVIGPTLVRTPADPAEQALALLYPVLDFVLFTALVSLLFRSNARSEHGLLTTLAASLTALILTDAAVALQLAWGRYEDGGWLDVGWSLAYALLWLAAQQKTPEASAERGPAVWWHYLPYLWVALLGGLLAWSRTNSPGYAETILEVGFFIVVGLVLVRQFLVMRDNRQLYAAAQAEVAQRRQTEATVRQLNRELEARVEERTAQLERANQELRVSEARNRVLLQAVPDLILILDGQGVYRDVYAPETSRLYAPPELLLGRTLREVLPPAVAALIEPALAAAVVTGQRQTVEYPLPLAKGLAHFEARLMPYGPDTVLAIVRDITERRQTQAALLESERRFRETLENVELVAVRLDDGGRVTFCNDYLVRLLGWDRAEILGQEWFTHFVPPELALQAQFVDLIRADRVPTRFENPILTRSGEVRLIAWTNTTLRDADGRVIGLAGLGEDITLRRQAEDRLRASLQEKEVLLKEIHHRVKNNLQVISSLLNLQARTVTDGRVLELLRDSQNRVRSMALVHEKLYRSTDLGRIDLGEYARSLAGQLLRTYADQAGRVALRVEAAGCWVGIDTSVACGLILNELVSNALKHAFPDGRTGAIVIGLTAEGERLRLRVADDGVGFPAGVDFRATPSLGLQLVNSLVTQIDGAIALDRAAGTEFVITFPAAGQEA